MDFGEKVEQLQQELKKAQTTLRSEKCISVTMIAAGVVPVLVFLVLFFLSPKFVQVRNGNEYTRSLKKVFTWTALMSILLWIGIYLFTYCNGYEADAICMRF
jgi:hypothetical protein